MAINKKLQKNILDAIDNQLRDNTPPQVNITFSALKKLGYSDRDAKLAIGQALVTEMFDVMKTGWEYDEEKYTGMLKQIAQGRLLYTEENSDEDDFAFDADPYEWEDSDDEDVEEFMDPDEPAEFLWQDLYRDYTIDDLHESAVSYGIRTKNRSKEEICRAIAEKLLEPQQMIDSFVRMNDDMADQVDKLMNEGFLCPEERFMDMIHESMVNSLYFHFGLGASVISCNEVQKAYMDINTPEFRGARREWNWTFQCLSVFLMHYGVGPVSAFADLYNTHPQLSIKEDEVFDHLKKMGKDICREYFQVNNMIVSRALQKKKEWKKLQSVQADYPFRKFTYEEVKDLGSHQYPCSHPDWTQMRELLDEAENGSYMKEECMRMLFRYVNAKLKPDDYFRLLDSMFIRLNEEETDRFAELCQKILKSTPLLERRGSCNPQTAIDLNEWKQAAEAYKEMIRNGNEINPGDIDDCPF